MTISLVSQQEFGNTAGTTNPDVCSPISASVGDYLVAVVHVSNGGSSSSATDSAGNVWVQRAVLTNGSHHISILTCAVTNALSAGSVSVSYPPGTAWDHSINISRWSGVTSIGGTATRANLNGPTITFAAAEAAVVAGITDLQSGRATAVSDGFTALTGRAQGWAGMVSEQAYKIGVGGTFSPTWTFPSNVNDVAAAVALIGVGPDYSAAADSLLARPRSLGPDASLPNPRVRVFADILVDPTTSTAALAAILPALTGDLDVQAPVHATATGVLPGVTAAMAAEAAEPIPAEPVTAAITATLPAVVGAAAGRTPAAGDAAAVLPLPVAALYGTVAVTGTVGAALPALQGQLAADIPVAAAIGVVLPAPRAALDADVPALAALAADLPAVTAALATEVRAGRRDITITLAPPRARRLAVTGPRAVPLGIDAARARVLTVGPPQP